MKRLLLAILVFTALPASAADKWTSVRSKNFLLVGNASEKQIREVAEDLELFRSAISRFFNLRDGSSVGTTVVVFRDDGAFRPYKPLYKGKPANVAGYFLSGQDTDYIALTADQETPRVIYHEYVHALTRDNLSDVPPWFAEGFAEMNSGLEVEGRDRKLRLGRAIGEHVELLKESRFMPLEKLFAVTHDSPDYNEEEKQGVFYAQSWAFVHFTMLGDGGKRRPQLTEFMARLKAGAPVVESFQGAFGTDIPTFQKMLEAYVQERVAWPAMEITPQSAINHNKETQARSISEAESEFYLGDLLLHIGRLPESDAHLKKAIQLDGRLAAAQASMGMLRMRQKNDAEALGYLERAASLDSGNHLVHYYYASLVRNQVGNAMPAETQWQTMRSELTKSIQIAPQFVEATEMLARINMTRNVDVAETVEMLRKAVDVSPGRDSLALLLAHALSRTPERELARPWAQRLSASASADAATRQSAQGLIDYLDRLASANRFAPESAARSAPEPRPFVRVPADDTETPVLRRDPRPDPEPPSTTIDEPPVAGPPTFSGLMTLMDCSKGLTISVNAGGRIVKFHSDMPSGITFTTFTPAVSQTISCGPTPPPGIPVVITYRPGVGDDVMGDPLTVVFQEPN